MGAGITIGVIMGAGIIKGIIGVFPPLPWDWLWSAVCPTAAPLPWNWLWSVCETALPFESWQIDEMTKTEKTIAKVIVFIALFYFLFYNKSLGLNTTNFQTFYIILCITFLYQTFILYKPKLMV